jgi:predicted phosphodiesterase
MGGETVKTGASHKQFSCAPAVILYPSLVTPDVMWGKAELEILLLGTEKDSLTPEHVNRQLKIDRSGLNPAKYYFSRPLFDKDPEKQIREVVNKKKATPSKKAFKGAALEANKTFSTYWRFSGLLDERAYKRYEKEGYVILYNIVINISDSYYPFSKKGLYNLFWYHPLHYSITINLGPEGTEVHPHVLSSLSGKSHFSGQEKVHPYGLDDKIVERALKDLNGDKLKGEKGCYCFKVGDKAKDVDFTTSDFSNPIMSYHPVYYNGDLKYANIAHMSDLHICSRDTLLSKSTARVIDEKDDGSMDNISPRIGTLSNIRSRNTKKLLDKIGEDSDVDILLITGDLIDYNRGLCLDKGDLVKGASAVWEKVDLDDSGKYEKNYQHFVDMIAFYSLIVYFYQKFDKPVFIVSGNHDSYADAYGIAPKAAGLFRANEGIPADQNLTVYEAALAFGPSSNTIVGSGIDPDMLKWFYSVLTPFSDFSLEMNGQHLIGLGWGDEEDLIRGKGDAAQHSTSSFANFMGHLPRADKAVSEKQLQLVKDASTSGKKMILMSHFTFVSYAGDIPENKPVGEISTLSAAHVPTIVGPLIFPSKIALHNQYDMGTFELNRTALYRDYIYKLKYIQCVLTGHSHRKGVYRLKKAGTTAETEFIGFSKFSEKYDPKNPDPLIIVSDSAGPIPRFNMEGELNGWGSDNPSATKLTFESAKGAVSSVDCIKSSCKPRFVVAVDYLDLLEKPMIIIRSQEFESHPWPAEHKFKISLASEVSRWAEIESPIYVYLYSKNTKWKRLTVSYDKNSPVWTIGDSSLKKYFVGSDNKEERALFMSIKFKRKAGKKAISQYDFDSRWNFEFEMSLTARQVVDAMMFADPGLIPPAKKNIYRYDVTRIKEMDDDQFKWRRKNFAKY